MNQTTLRIRDSGRRVRRPITPAERKRRASPAVPALFAVFTCSTMLAALAQPPLRAPARAPREAAPGVWTAPADAVSPERLERISRRYLGVPYRLDCLGEGEGSDPDPIARPDCVDCQTYVEQVMAEALSTSLAEFEILIRKLRYRNGIVRLENRYHYCDPDWLQSPWPVRDITPELHAPLRVDRRRIDLPHFLASRGADAALSPIRAQNVRAGYLPRASAMREANHLPNGTIALFVLDRPDIVAGHLGFLFRKAGGVFLRHASQTHKKVVEEPLRAYLVRAPKRFIGMKVLQPDTAGLQRREMPPP